MSCSSEFSTRRVGFELMPPGVSWMLTLGNDYFLFPALRALLILERFE